VAQIINSLLQNLDLNAFKIILFLLFSFNLFFLLLAILFRFIIFLEIFNNSWIFFSFNFGKFSALISKYCFLSILILFVCVCVRFQLEACRPVTIPHTSLILYSAFFILSFFALVRIFSEPFSSSLNLYSGKSNPFLSQFFELLSSGFFFFFFFLLLAFQFNFIS